MVKKGKKSGYRSFTVVRVGKHGSCKTKGNCLKAVYSAL